MRTALSFLISTTINVSLYVMIAYGMAHVLDENYMRVAGLILCAVILTAEITFPMVGWIGRKVAVTLTGADPYPSRTLRKSAQQTPDTNGPDIR